MNLSKKPYKKGEPVSPKEQKRKVMKVKGFIYATVVFSHGWNDPSEIINNQTGIILDIISDENSIDSRLNYWNKIYYDDITSHYPISEDQLESISKIINVPKEKYRDLHLFWPKTISNLEYGQIFEKINLAFVQYKSIEPGYENRYAIIICESFWNIKIRKRRLLQVIINTHESRFKGFELIHATYGQAMNYGIIIMDRLCNQSGPDNSYYYEQRIKEQSKQFKELPIFNYNSFKPNKGGANAEYIRIINDRKSDLNLMRTTIESLSDKPFEIIKISDKA